MKEKTATLDITSRRAVSLFAGMTVAFLTTSTAFPGKVPSKSSVRAPAPPKAKTAPKAKRKGTPLAHLLTKKRPDSLDFRKSMDAVALLNGSKTVTIRHKKNYYILRATQKGKLLLNAGISTETNKQVSSEEMFSGDRQISIRFGESLYLLSVTKADKLVLTRHSATGATG